MKEIPEFQNLSVPERLELVSAIWNSIFHDLEEFPISSTLRQDLESELEEHRRDPNGSRSWELVDGELFGDE
ncbi:MAG: addiction module protein [Acidobacteriota bacterium]